MYIDVKRENLLKYDKLKLCYIDSIDQTYRDYTPIEEKQEYYAYFTPAELDKQWGDDWDDAPYEYNAEIPYDDYYEEDTKVELNIMRVPFNVYHDGWHVRFPKDWGGENSPFCVKDINAGAVAWIYDNSSTTAICAGCNPEEFFRKLDIINEKHKE